MRWTFSNSTVAAVFFAVFFVASEAAQQFFGETLGSAYVGIADALVFAIAPLQRMAESLASAAVPVTTPRGAQGVALAAPAATRRPWGAAVLAAGFGLYIIFLVTIPGHGADRTILFIGHVLGLIGASLVLAGRAPVGPSVPDALEPGS